MRKGGAHIFGRELAHVAQELTGRGVDARDAAILIMLCCAVQRLVELRRRLVCTHVTAIIPARRSTEGEVRGQGARSGCERTRILGASGAHRASHSQTG